MYAVGQTVSAELTHLGSAYIMISSHLDPPDVIVDYRRKDLIPNATR